MNKKEMMALIVVVDYIRFNQAKLSNDEYSSNIVSCGNTLMRYVDSKLNG